MTKRKLQSSQPLSKDSEDEEISDDFDEEENHSDVKEGKAGGSLLPGSKLSTKGGMMEPSAKIPKLQKDKLYKPPTAEEMNQLKETENLFHSSLFRMQITELLCEICLKEERKKQIEKTLHSLREILLGLPDGEEHHLENTKWLMKKIKVPFIQVPEMNKGKFRFLSPQRVKIMGSFVLDTCIKPDIHVDMVVEIPKKCTNAKDYLNHRYLKKRALYLACIAEHLQDEDIVESLDFSYHHGNHYKPFLIINAKTCGKKNVRIHLLLVPEDGTFKLGRFHISRNNVRRQWFDDSSALGEKLEGDQPPTPFYNMSVLQDLTMQTSLEYLHQAQENSVGVKEGIVLLKVWLKQRELDMGYGGLSGFTLSMYVAYLLSRKRINKLMSSFQVMRNTLLCLSSSDWTADGITLCDDSPDTNHPTMPEFQKAFDVVFVDFTGYVNYCAGMTKSSFYRAKHEAGLAIDFLEKRDIDGFEKIFINPVPFIRKFDHMIHIKCTKDFGKSVNKLNLGDRLLDLGGHHVHAFIPYLLDVLHRALEKRVHLIQVRQDPTKKWSISESPPSFEETEKITIGLLLNNEFSNSVIEKGPQADSPEAKTFQEFWGEKSEMRRFQDGSICEAVLWTAATKLSKKRLVCSKIVQYILNRHAGIAAENILYVGGQLGPLLHLPQDMTQKASIPYGTGEEQHVSILHSYDSLCKILRNLPSLPLTINSIQGTSPVMRFCEVFPAMPAVLKETREKASHQYPRPDKPAPAWVPPVNVVCMLEGSGKWPEEKEAVRRLKAAFHITLGELLTNHHSLPVQISMTHVNVLKDGFVFRVRLSYMREIAIAKTFKMPDGMVKKQDTEESAQLEKEIIVLPKLTSTLHGIQQQHNNFSSTARLAKRWLSAHMLLGHIPEEAVELLVAYLYISPAPNTVPGSPMVGFLRFLNILSSFDWKVSPLLVNLNSDFTQDDLTEIPMKFSKERSTLPLMFIATPQDRFSSHWTKKIPTGPILNRAALTAHESLLVLEQQMSTVSTETDFKQIFRPPLSMFDVIIHLHSRELPRQHQGVDITTETVIPSTAESSLLKGRVKSFPVVDYNPAEIYLGELRAAYDDLAIFFYDAYGGTLIGVLWKPQAFHPKEFKVSHIAGRKLKVGQDFEEEVMLQTNFETILEDFQVIGGPDLVKSIERKADR